MGTIRICDWSKKMIGPGDQVYKLIVNGKEYEISADSANQLIGRLDSTTPAITPSPMTTSSMQVPRLELNVEVQNPFGGKLEPGLLDDESQNGPEVAPVPTTFTVAEPIPIPASIKERLPIPTPAQVEAVVSQSRRLPEKTLPALSPGRSRSLAEKKLIDRESNFEDNKRPVPDRRGE